MYAKSMIDSVHARAIAGAWSKHLGFAPVALALAVAVLPFTLEPYFEKSTARAVSSVPSVQTSTVARRQPLPLISAAQEAPLSAMASVNTLAEPALPPEPVRVALPLDAQQRAVARFIVNKYNVGQDFVQELVRIAYTAGKKYGIDPLLVVAIMSVESSFNPGAESWAGAKGLMQIIPKYHLEKFTEFGGERTIFNPRVNIMVGARIVREYLNLGSGDLVVALQTYSGGLADRDAIYTNRVLNAKDQLDELAGLPKTDRSSKVVVQLNPLQPVSMAPAPAQPLQGPPAPTPVQAAPAAPATPATPTTSAPSALADPVTIVPLQPISPPAAKPVDDAAAAPAGHPAAQQPQAALTYVKLAAISTSAPIRR